MIKLAVVAALGAPAVAVLIFEVLLNATSMFNHSNVRIPLGIDRHPALVRGDAGHASRPPLDSCARETNSNFGFNLPWWDRLFGTYRAQPAAGHDGMTIGIEQFRDPRELGLDRMLLQPFRGDAGRYPLGRREGRSMSTRHALPRIVLALLLVAAVRSGCAFIASKSTWRRLKLRSAGLAGLWAPDRRTSCSLRSRTVAVRPRRDLRPCRRRPVRAALGYHLSNLIGCHAWRNRLLSWSRATSRRTGSGDKAGGLPQAAHRWRRCGGLAFRCLRAAGAAISLQPVQTTCSGSRASRSTTTCLPRLSAWYPARSPTRGSGMPGAGR